MHVNRELVNRWKKCPITTESNPRQERRSEEGDKAIESKVDDKIWLGEVGKKKEPRISWCN